MSHGSVETYTAIWIVYNHFGDEVTGLGIGSVSKHLVPANTNNFRQLLVLIVWVHCSNVFFSWCTKLFNDLNQLCMRVITMEQRLSLNYLGYDAAC